MGDGNTISKCYSTGACYGLLQTGGLVGNNGATINDCYSRASATSSNNETGGFVGRNTGTITNSYSTGVPLSQNSHEYEGGFAGNNIGTITNCFWDTETSGTSSSAGGTGKTTAEMKTQSTFTGWDFTDVWEIVGGNGANYPRLKDNADPALPVELSMLNAVTSINCIELRWRTETEVNNYGFEIERGIENGKLQIENWEKIGFVAGHGNSNSPKDYSFVDDISALSLSKCKYRLKQIDFDGKYEYSKVVEVTIDLPTKFVLEQNYPNPFNPTTTIEFTLAEDGFTTLKIFDILGREVATLVNEELKAGGIHNVTLNANHLSSGLYFYRLESNKSSLVKKLMLMK